MTTENHPEETATPCLAERADVDGRAGTQHSLCQNRGGGSPDANENLRRMGAGGSRFPEFGFGALTGGQWSDFNASDINMSSDSKLKFRAFGTT